MQRIETRTELINFICENIKQNAIVRACHRGTVQVLGGFSLIPPSTRPGWITVVTSLSGQTWLVAVTAHDHQHVFRAWVAKEIPWEYYVGKVGQEEYSIYNGDNPVQAFIARKKHDRTR